VAYDNGKTRRKIDDNSSGMMTAVVVVKRFTLQSVVSKLAQCFYKFHTIPPHSPPIASYRNLFISFAQENPLQSHF